MRGGAYGLTASKAEGKKEASPEAIGRSTSKRTYIQLL